MCNCLENWGLVDKDRAKFESWGEGLGFGEGRGGRILGKTSPQLNARGQILNVGEGIGCVWEERANGRKDIILNLIFGCRS